MVVHSPSGNISIGLLEGFAMCSFNLKLKNKYTFLAHPHIFPCTNTYMHIVYEASYTHKLAGYYVRRKQSHSETKHTDKSGCSNVSSAVPTTTHSLCIYIYTYMYFEMKHWYEMSHSVTQTNLFATIFLSAATLRSNQMCRWAMEHALCMIPVNPPCLWPT